MKSLIPYVGTAYHHLKMYIIRTTQITKTIVAEKPTKEIQFKNKHIKRDWEQEQMGQIADLNSTKAAINLKTV